MKKKTAGIRRAKTTDDDREINSVSHSANKQAMIDRLAKEIDELVKQQAKTRVHMSEAEKRWQEYQSKSNNKQELVALYQREYKIWVDHYRKVFNHLERKLKEFDGLAHPEKPEEPKTNYTKEPDKKTSQSREKE